MTEADLCREFRELAEASGWTVHPEVSGWDLLLVAGETVKVRAGWNKEVAPGRQVGVEAKLRANVTVLRQAAEGMQPRSAPTYGVVLVPRAGKDFRKVARLLRLNVWTLGDVGSLLGPWIFHAHEEKEPLWVPPVVSNREAGTPAPSPLTPWRVKALRLCNLLDAGAEVTRGDVQALGISPKLWVDRLWLVPTGRKRGRAELLRKGDGYPGWNWPAEGFEEEARDLASQEGGAEK